MSLILASNSSIRRAMLEQAGLQFEQRSPNFDEQRAKEEGLVGDPLVRRLAEGKAASIPAAPGQLVIGSDSSVTVEGQLFSKPANRGEAHAHLRRFSGQEMRLSSAVALAAPGEPLWSHAETATLKVRSLSEAFIADYLDQEWPEVGYCVGVFRLEGRGVTLFDHIEGSYFTILGMPLLPLLAQLRARGQMQS